MNILIYNGGIWVGLTSPISRDKPFNTTWKCSVNEDFEESISAIGHGQRVSETTHIFLHPMLSQSQLKLIERKEESYLQSFGHYLIGFSPDVQKEELEMFPDADPKLRLIRCPCIRRSFYLEAHQHKKIKQ